ncbi:MAG: hypothetical protein WAN44_09930 [Propionibacteriaceae bacterium]
MTLQAKRIEAIRRAVGDQFSILEAAPSLGRTPPHMVTILGVI